jgi:hypothetical protein
MADALSLLRLDADAESYATLYEHPEHGKIRVGTISRRTSLGNIIDPWSWSIATNLAPEYSPDRGAAPNEDRTWVRRAALRFHGTAATKKAAIAAWKQAWPRFRDARTEAEWHDLKAEQDRGEKKIMIYDAYKLPGVTPEIREELQREMGRPGPAPHWLLEMIERGRAS